MIVVTSKDARPAVAFCNAKTSWIFQLKITLPDTGRMFVLRKFWQAEQALKSILKYYFREVKFTLQNCGELLCINLRCISCMAVSSRDI
ncbi:hypothetical protein ABUK73_00595 [Agrobacterium sp. BA1120]|uniref:hypothetical protein n=1 Tax=Agrobacterium sp. BA1120 TaxID=3228927 RepID=UPI00336A487D